MSGGDILSPAIAGDGSLYPVEKMQAHIDGVLHLAVSVFVFDGDLLLIQRRAAGKYHCPGLWANSCCTHPNWNESLELSAARRLREELGVTLPLARHATVEYDAPVGRGLREHERVTFFSGQTDRRQLEIAPAPAEVDAVDWIDRFELRRAVLSRPESFAPWLRIYLELFPTLDFGQALPASS